MPAEPRVWAPAESGAQLDLGAGDAAGRRAATGPELSNLAPHPSRLYAVDESGAYAYDADA